MPAKKNKNKSPRKTGDKRRVSPQQVIFIVISIFIILSMILSFVLSL